MGIRLKFRSCWSCGHVWTSLAPEELRAFIEKHGREVAKQQLEASELADDLPDCPEARAAASGVAEIDTLVLAGNQPGATRRFRELTHTTWDHAIDAVRDWQDLKRPQKLALFGWCPKQVSPATESAVTEHPMRDRWLDG
jgi:hypothetical protein